MKGYISVKLRQGFALLVLSFCFVVRPKIRALVQKQFVVEDPD